jgi:flagellar motor switch protein FliN/FliY
MANEPLMSQDEIERLFSQTKGPVVAASKDPSPAAAPQAAAETAPAAPLSQDSVDSLLRQAATSPPSPRAAGMPPPTASMPAAAAAPPSEMGIAPQDIDYLLDQAERALSSATAGGQGDFPPGVAAYPLQEFAGTTPSAQAATIDLIRDVELDLKIELGRTHMYLEDVLKLRSGSVVALDKLAGDPVDIYVNGRLVARGEVLVLNDNFCVRVAELIAGSNDFAA